MILFGFILGTILGSFAKASADRIAGQTSIRGRSYCLNCKARLQWYDLFPILSFVFLKGKCRSCHHQIPRENLLAEIIVGVMVALLFWSSNISDLTIFTSFNAHNILLLSDLIFKLFVIVVLSIVLIIDLKTGLIHNRITYPATIIAIFYLLFYPALTSWFFYQAVLNSKLGPYLLPPKSTYLYNHLQAIWEPSLFAVLSAFVAASIFVLLIIVTKGKGMGWGDVKYVFFLGLTLGFPNIAAALFLAFLSGAVFSLSLIILKKKHFGQTIPFGPFLSIGAFLALLWGQQLINWYLNSFRLGY